MGFVRVLALAAFAWAAAALAAQVVQARRARGRDHSRAAGDPRRGLFYSFTGAMMPAHKESVRRHPLEFGTGVLMHAGTIVALAAVLIAAARPTAGLALLGAARPLILLSFLAAAALLVRRAASRTLRLMSAADDYVAIVATVGLLVSALHATRGETGPTAFLGYGALLFVYFPLGKLRHAVFFFLARADYGRRLGYRGVYPPARAAGG